MHEQTGCRLRWPESTDAPIGREKHRDILNIYGISSRRSLKLEALHNLRAIQRQKFKRQIIAQIYVDMCYFREDGK
jgi:hypothetical protein